MQCTNTGLSTVLTQNLPIANLDLFLEADEEKEHHNI